MNKTSAFVVHWCERMTELLTLDLRQRRESKSITNTGSNTEELQSHATYANGENFTDVVIIIYSYFHRLT